jgi:hypothetical protein
MEAAVAGTWTALLAATHGETSSPSDWLLPLLVALLGSSVVGGLLTVALGNLRASATARRDGYSSAVRTLIARAEYPYRVRRRVSNYPDVLAGLAARGHELQEELAASRTWVSAEHRVLGECYEAALQRIDDNVTPATAEAWTLPPVAAPEGMNLAGWGPGDQWAHVAELERAIAFRFGWRRLLPTRWWRNRVRAQAPDRGT